MRGEWAAEAESRKQKGPGWGGHWQSRGLVLRLSEKRGDWELPGPGPGRREAVKEPQKAEVMRTVWLGREKGHWQAGRQLRALLGLCQGTGALLEGGCGGGTGARGSCTQATGEGAVGLPTKPS